MSSPPAHYLRKGLSDADLDALGSAITSLIRQAEESMEEQALVLELCRAKVEIEEVRINRWTCRRAVS